MKSWMLAVIVACNIQLVHKTKSTQIHPTKNMLLAISAMPSKMSGIYVGRTSLSTNCILSPYSELSKHLIGDSRVTCGTRSFSFKSRNPETTWTKLKVSAVVRYVRALRWTPIPIGLGFAYIAYMQLRHIKKRESSKLVTSTSPSEIIATDFQVSFYRMLPLRVTSRFWGWMNTLDLPGVIRRPVLNAFIYTYGCDVHEAIVEDLNQYHNLGEFFGRSLKPEMRPIHLNGSLVSPCDGTVLHFGVIENDLVEQVKGITYSLKSFLGPHPFKEEILSKEDYHQHFLSKKDTALYHCVLYLAPGDYHKFHSPADWTVLHRRHFPGDLLSVRPSVVNWIAGLFNLNERVVYSGEWKYGFFSMTAVGATNVGSIKVYFDKYLETNKKKCRKGLCEEMCFLKPGSRGIPVNKGCPFGEFNLGSTVVLIFEGPKDMSFNVERGHKIKYGELLGLCHNCEAA